MLAVSTPQEAGLLKHASFDKCRYQMPASNLLADDLGERPFRPWPKGILCEMMVTSVAFFQLSISESGLWDHGSKRTPLKDVTCKLYVRDEAVATISSKC